MIDASGRWSPNLSSKQLEVWNDNRRHILLSGPRLTGKSLVAVHCAIKHGWLYPNDRVGIFTKSTKVGVGGIWGDLLDYGLPEWEEGMGEEGFKIITVGQYGDTRQRYVRISNRHGGESEISLNSLHYDEDVSPKLKGTRWGMLLFDECDVYESEDVFNISVLQLRQIGLLFEKHRWMGTANPPPEGQEHWLYKKFWQEPYDETLNEKDRKSFGLYEFKLADNTFLRPEEIERLRSTYKNDPDSFARLVNGFWTADLRKAHFAGAFLQNQHVRGSAEEGTVILPREGEIVTGWDLGSRNHSVVFLQKVIHASGDYWSVLDEVSRIDEDVSIEAVTLEVVAKMRELEALVGKKLRFKHWSDKSAWDYRSSVDARDHVLVHRYSQGEIDLIGCPKGPNSVAARIALTRQLLIQKRLYISANCVGIIDMFKKLSKGKTKSEPIKRDKAGNIHRFDALSYALLGENIDEIDQSLRPKLITRPQNFSL